MADLQIFSFGDVTVNHDARRIPVRSTDRLPGRYPYFGASGVVDHIASYLFDGDYLLVAEDGENLRTRKTPVAFIATGKFWVNNHAHIVQGNHLASTRYLCYALEMTDISGHLSGSTQPKLTQDSMNRIKICLPSRERQEIVVKVLHALDDKIFSNEELATKTREIAQVCFRASLDAESISCKISSVASAINRGVTPRYSEDPDQVLVLNQKCIRGGRAELRLARRTLTEKVTTEKLLQPNDVLVNSTGIGTLGRVARWTLDIPCTVDSHVTIVRFDDARTDPVCTGFAMLAAQPEIETLGEGSTGQTELSRAKLSSLYLKLPTPAGVEDLRPRLNALEARADAALAEAATLSRLRDTLLPKLMSGELRVRDAEKVVEEAT